MRKLTFKEFQNELVSNFEEINEFILSTGKKWWAHSGTLLGAVRHNGLIPWDDDIDMTMSIHDFREIQDQLSEFLKTKKWTLYDRTKIKGLGASTMMSDEKIIVTFEGKEYVTKLFVDLMISIPKEKISKFERKVWCHFNRMLFVYSSFYRVVPYYGWFGSKIKKITWIQNFLVFLSKIFIMFIPTYWLTWYQKWFLNKKDYESNKVAMYYTYDNKGLIYDIDKINTKIKFGKTEVLVSDSYEDELNLWFGKNWREFPPKWNQVPHHFVLTPNDKNAKRYKISPFIIK